MNQITTAEYSYLKIETKKRVGWITIARPAAMNALNAALMRELLQSLQKLDQDPDVGCIVLTGSNRVFSVGADIKEAANKRWPETYLENFLATWEGVARIRKPIVAAVAGYALGGGCELALMCDVIIAAENARFALPEVRIGTMPGAGGTQRLARSIGKAKAMELCLTGRQIDAKEANLLGLVSRTVTADTLLSEAGDTAEQIAAGSLPSVMAIKESITAAFDSGMSQGLAFERRLFQALFATQDQKEGMLAFIEKRAPVFEHR